MSGASRTKAAVFERSAGWTESCETLSDRPGGAADLPDAGPGSLLAGRYSIGPLLGMGGHSRVYRAVDQLLGEEVALKVLRPARPSWRLCRRILTEVRLARMVSHRNICRIHDAGTFRAATGAPDEAALVPFLTMELVQGETLRDRVQRTGALPLGEASRLARQLAAGVAAIHRAGVIHRDLKSANVLVAGAGEDVRAVVIDFGLAQDGSSWLEDEPLVRSRGRGVIGTPAYMAPEQVLGLTATMASDVYALGSTFYEMVTGEVPFADASHLGMVARKMAASSAPDLRQLRPDVPSTLNRVIQRCLAHHPLDRYRSAMELMGDL